MVEWKLIEIWSTQSVVTHTLTIKRTYDKNLGAGVGGYVMVVYGGGVMVITLVQMNSNTAIALYL